MSALRQWAAPEAPARITATVAIPGSKSETNRALILAALASGPSVSPAGCRPGTPADADALRTLGVQIIEKGDQWEIARPNRWSLREPLIAALPAQSCASFRRLPHSPMAPRDLTAMSRRTGDRWRRFWGRSEHLGARIDGSGHSLPFNLTGSPQLRGGSVTVDAAESSQFLSGLLLAGARYAHGLDIHHIGGEIPSSSAHPDDLGDAACPGSRH